MTLPRISRDSSEVRIGGSRRAISSLRFEGVDEFSLTPEQEIEAERIEDILKAGAQVEIRRIARLLASKENRQLFGETEFQVRDIVHRIGARSLDALLRVMTFWTFCASSRHLRSAAMESGAS